MSKAWSKAEPRAHDSGGTGHWPQEQLEASFFWGAEQRNNSFGFNAKFLLTNIAAKCWRLLSSESYSPNKPGSLSQNWDFWTLRRFALDQLLGNRHGA